MAKRNSTNTTPIKKGVVKPKLTTVEKRIIKQKADMLRALELSLGIVSIACRKVNITKVTHYRWLKSDESYKEDVHYIKEDAIDFVITSLFEQIRDKNTTATIFFLKTQAKDRGYGSTRYYTNNTPQYHDPLLKDKTEEELLEILKTFDYYIK